LSDTERCDNQAKKTEEMLLVNPTCDAANEAIWPGEKLAALQRTPSEAEDLSALE
jgi:hypothetical protein